MTFYITNHWLFWPCLFAVLALGYLFFRSLTPRTVSGTEHGS